MTGTIEFEITAAEDEAAVVEAAALVEEPLATTEAVLDAAVEDEDEELELALQDRL